MRKALEGKNWESKKPSTLKEKDFWNSGGTLELSGARSIKHLGQSEAEKY